MSSQTDTGLPGFSIIIETRNTSPFDLMALSGALSSLAAQDPSPAHANEVIVVDSGDMSAAELEQVCAPYSWITIHRVESEVTLYEAKMAGLPLVTGEIVMFVDSDSRVKPGWLKNVLEPFAEDDDIHIVTGETSIKVNNPYDLAIALIWIFPPFSDEEDLTSAAVYYGNAFAIRRELMERHPYQFLVDTYGTLVHPGAKHTHDLRALGYTIWRQPKAHAYHLPPPPATLIRRFVMHALASVTLGRLSSDPLGNERQWRRRYHTRLERVRAVFSEDRARRLLFLPLSLPFVAVATLSYLFGRIASSISPQAVAFLLRESSAARAELAQREVD